MYDVDVIRVSMMQSKSASHKCSRINSTRMAWVKKSLDSLRCAAFTHLLSFSHFFIRGALGASAILSVVSVAQAEGLKSFSAQDQEPPKAHFSYRLEPSLSASRVTFDAKLSDDNVGLARYQWRFGDGTYLSGAKAKLVSHSYPSGDFKVSLTVTDFAGLTSTYHSLVSIPSKMDNAQSTAKSDKPVQAASANSPTHETIVAALDNTEDNANPLAKPSPPEPLAPKPDSILFNGMNVSFIWAALAGADLYDFRILNAKQEEVVRVGEFTTQTMCRGKRCRLRQEISLDYAKEYNWQVRAHRPEGWSDWSSFSFSVLPQGLSKPKMPLILFPGPNATVVNDETVTFLWEHHTTTESYRFQLVNRETGEILLDTRAQERLFCDPQQCAYPRPIKLAAGDHYAWQIQAANKAGESGWFRNSFTVIDSETVVRPVASFKHEITADEELKVRFDASKSTAADSIASYQWVFGDGMSAEGHDQKKLEHRFAEAGSYWTTLTVVDKAGNQHSTRQLIHVGAGVLPESKFLVDGFNKDIAGAVPLTVTFDPKPSTAETAIVEYRWDFGDGSEISVNTEAAIVSHSYTAAGDFVATLTITDERNFKSISSRRVSVGDSIEALSIKQAGRFLAQSTFGASESDIKRLMETGYENWLAEQFELIGGQHLEYVKQFTDERSQSARHEVWWQDVVKGKDQLRQRVAFALSQIFHIADSPDAVSGSERATAALYDLLREHAFGNYRELLEVVSLNPAMALQTGLVLNSAERGDAVSDPSKRSQVDLKFAQQLLSRFTIGDSVLEIDGTDTSEEAYDRNTVSEFARAFTGWNLHGLDEWIEVNVAADNASLSAVDWEKPLYPFEEKHDRKTKQLLGGVVTPPNINARQDMQLALDNVFAHPNVGPFIGKKLIQKLVTSNPSSRYIERVAKVFNDNGAGVRGDLKAVIASILLDEEARTIPRTSHFGRLKEPVLRLAHLWRAFDVQPGTASTLGAFELADIELSRFSEATGLTVLSSPDSLLTRATGLSPQGFIKDAGLVAPEFGVFSSKNNRAINSIINRQIYRQHSATANSDDLQFAYIDFSDEVAIADNPDRLISKLNTVLLGGTMSADLFDVLRLHLNKLPDTPTGHLTRVQDAVSLIMSSPDYLVQM